MNWLKQRREELNLSQRDLAEKLAENGFRITPGTVSHWETGRHRPPFEDKRFQQVLALLLKMKVGEMLNLAGYDVSRSNHSQEAEEAAYIIDSLSPAKKNLAVRLLKELAKDEPL